MGNNKGTGQPVHPCSLLSTCLECVFAPFIKSKLLRFQIVSVADQVGCHFHGDSQKGGLAQIYDIK